MARTPERDTLFTPFKPCPRNVPSFDNMHTNGNGHEANGSLNGKGVSKALLRIGEFVPDKVYTNGNGHHKNGHSNGNGHAHKELLLLYQAPRTPTISKPDIDIDDASYSFKTPDGIQTVAVDVSDLLEKWRKESEGRHSTKSEEQTVTTLNPRSFELQTNEPKVTPLERTLFGQLAEDIISQKNKTQTREVRVKKEKASALPDRIKIYDAHESALVKKWQKAIDRGDKQDALQAAVEIDTLETRHSDTFLGAVRNSRIKKADAQRRNRTN